LKLSHLNLSKNLIYCNIRDLIKIHYKWFKKFTKATFKLLLIDIENLLLSANTKNIIFDSLKFFREVVKFIKNFKSYSDLKKYEKGDIISNLTLIETIMNEIILKFNFKEIEIFLNQVIQKHENPAFFDSKIQEILYQILYNIQKFEKKSKLIVFYITRLKNFLKKL